MGWLVRGVMSATAVADIEPLLRRIPSVRVGLRGQLASLIAILLLQVAVVVGIVGIGSYRRLAMGVSVVWAVSSVVTFSSAFDLVMPGRIWQRVIARWSGWFWVAGFAFWFSRSVLGGGSVVRPSQWPPLWCAHLAALIGTVIAIGYLSAMAGGLDLWSSRRRLSTVAWLLFPLGLVQWLFPWKHVAVAGFGGGIGMWLIYYVLLACVPMWWLLLRSSTGLWEMLNVQRWSRHHARTAASRSDRVDASRARIDASVAAQVRQTQGPEEDIEVE